MKLSQNSGVPIYQQIADQFKNDILNGKFEDGEYLAEFRSPFNSRNNLGYIHNIYHEYFDKYFKNYNYDRDKLIDNTTRHIFEINDLPKKPAPRKDATLPMNSSKLLSNIQTIYEAIQKAKNEHYDIILVDTAGRLQNKFNLMEELTKIDKDLLQAIADIHEIPEGAYNIRKVFPTW